MDDPRGVCESLELIACAAIDSDPRITAILIGASHKLRRDRGLGPGPGFLGVLGGEVELRLRDTLGEDTFAVTLAEGAVMTLDQLSRPAAQRCSNRPGGSQTSSVGAEATFLADRDPRHQERVDGQST